MIKLNPVELSCLRVVVVVGGSGGVGGDDGSHDGDGGRPTGAPRVAANEMYPSLWGRSIEWTCGE